MLRNGNPPLTARLRRSARYFIANALRHSGPLRAAMSERPSAGLNQALL